MMRILVLCVLFGQATMSTMACQSPLSLEKAKEIVKEVAIKVIENKEHHYEHTGVVVAPPPFIEAEVNAGALYIDEEKGILCADGKLFFVDFKKEILLNQLQLQPGSGTSHKPNAAITALASIKNMKGAADHEKILCGEEHGRVVLVDPLEYEFPTFGHVSGRINAFSCHPGGTQVAVTFVAKDSCDLPIPCFAISVAFLKNKLEREELTRKDNQDVWKPLGSWQWTPFLTKKCEKAVRSIIFDGELCITECASGFLESWQVKDPEINPQLIRVSIKSKY